MFALLLLLGLARADDVDTLIRQRRLGEAVVASDKALLANPADLDEHERWIDLQHALGRDAEAVARYARGLAARPDDPDLHYLAGRAAPDLDASRQAYERALRLAPSHARAWMGMGAIHRATGDLHAAAEAYQRALAADVTLEEAWNGLLVAVLGMGATEAALDVAKAATEAVPRDPEPWLALAALEPERARDHLLRASELMPTEPRIATALADLHLRQGHAADAVPLAERAVRLDPWSDEARALRLYARAIAAGALDARGWALLERLRKAPAADVTAAAEAQRAVDAWPNAAPAWLVRARFRGADVAGAEADLRKALSLAPGDDEASAALGGLLARTGRAREAAPLLVAAADARPHDASLAMSAARVALDAGDAAGARVRIDRAVARFRDDPLVPIAQADILTRTGDAEGAWVALSQAAARLPDVRVRIAQAAAGRAAGHGAEAALIYDELARLTGDGSYAKAAAEARAGR